MSQMPEKRKVIAVLGGRECDTATYQLAYEVGRGIAERRAVLICGGRNGVMEAACKGASEAGGLTIGVLPGEERSEANYWVTIAIPTGIGIARNSILPRACDAAIAIGGQYGTLSEIAYCLQIGKPVCALNSWRGIAGLIEVGSVQEALQFVFGG